MFGADATNIFQTLPINSKATPLSSSFSLISIRSCFHRSQFHCSPYWSLVSLLLRQVNEKLLLFCEFMTGLLLSSVVDPGTVPKCPANEQYMCGTTCPESCDYKPTFCRKDCRYGCFCKDGYVRQTNTTGSPCIKREDCNKQETPTKKCCKNQEFVTCGSACPPRCDDLAYPQSRGPKMCPDVCKIGCACKQGFYLKGKNRCVEPAKCCQGENEQFTSCGTACPETCNTKQPIACTRQCVAGCFCKSPDYVRRDNSTNSPCIPRTSCPK